MMKTNIILIIIAALLVSPAFAALQTAYGILDISGINPQTGLAWQHGDSYRLAFITSARHNAVSDDIELYNVWVTSLAEASSLGLTGFKWKVIGSTDFVDARDNTRTNPENPADPNGPTFLVDGTTLIANDKADLWDATYIDDVYAGGIQNPINQDENGVPLTQWPFTGTLLDGTAAPGTFGPLGRQVNGAITQGNGGANTSQWIWRTWTGKPAADELHFYAMSEPLYVIDPTQSFIPWPVHAGDSLISWLNSPVQLNPVAVNNDTADLTYYWSAESPDPNLVVTFDPAADSLDPSTSDAMAPTVSFSILDGEEVALPITVKLTFAVNNVGSTEADVVDSLTIDVYESACEIAKLEGSIEFDKTDLNQDCITDILDLAEFASTWLNDYSLDSPQPKY